MKVAIVLAILVSLSSAMIPWSFRYQSTAYLWEDDYDLIFDPARIPEIEGSRLWTMLSNFVSGYEHALDYSSDHFFLIGGSTHHGNLFPAAVYDRSSMKEALWTGLGEEYDPMYGEAMITTTTWQDTNGDGTPDLQTIETEKRWAYDQTDEADYYAGIGYHGGGNMRFGFGFEREEWKCTYTDPAYNFSYDYVAEGVTTGPTYIERSSAMGDVIDSRTDNEFRLSFWYDSDNWSLGLMGGYAMFDIDSMFIWSGDSVQYTFPDTLNPDDSLAGDYTITSWLDSLDAPQSGSRIPVRLALFYDYSETAQGRFWVGYTMESHSYADDAACFYSRTSQEIYSDFTYYYDTLTTTYDGEGSSNSITAGTHHLWNVTPRLNFGIGVIFNTSSYDDSVDMVTDIVNVYDYDDGDTITNELDDYRMTTRYSETWRRTVDGSSMSLTFPVGIEWYVVNPKLALRLGASHRLSFPDYTVAEKMVAYTPEEITYEYGDGTDTTFIQDQGEIPGTEEIHEETYSSTTYYFGAGWRFNKHLQIDFMSFTDLVDMDSWRLSATLHFD